MKLTLRWSIQHLVIERVTLASGLLQHPHISSCFHRRVYKAARVTPVGWLPYLRARVTLAGEVTFSLVNAPGKVNTPTWVNVVIVSRPFDCVLSFAGLQGYYPTCEIFLVNTGYLLTSSQGLPGCQGIPPIGDCFIDKYLYNKLLNMKTL